ncbi:GGDEF domain-containing protein [Azoarcus sp. KH32C]|uniref:GGDEF domain-containing protein n=1 Tax=Azoarcus sp. KH32C TaxID=748247 RepID=UPI000238600B|nr:GGDEF domain-containing protein [Azoarcus sp. KH32C]BAL24534.1 diguanylate cyclase/phosphodiesterase [Azoarcus sp. KH32C]
MKRLSHLPLHDRLLLVALLPVAVLASLVTTVVVYRGTRMLDEALQTHGDAIISFLAPAAEYGVIAGNREALDALLQAATEQRDVSAAALYDDAGNLLASKGRIRVLAPAELRTLRRGIVRGGTPEFVVMVAPIQAVNVTIDDVSADAVKEQPQDPIGWVHIELDARPSAHEKNTIIGAALAMLGFGLSLSGLLALRLARSVSKPVKALVEGVKRMKAGDLDVEITEGANNPELAALEKGFNAMARAISENHRTMQSRIDDATAQLAYQATHDPLTGLPNRRVFEQRIEECVAASRRRASDHGALCFIDLDRFKIVNDTCGHAAGDELLMRIAELIQSRIREQDTLCRVGGDEFALILHDCSREDALRLAEGLCESVADYRFEWHGNVFSIGASIGITYVDGRQSDPAEILIAADTACYQAKREGRNCVVESGVPTRGRRSSDRGLAPDDEIMDD